MSYTESRPYATDNFLIVARGGLIPVDVRSTTDGYLATDRLADRWGSGTTPDEALADLFDSLMDYLEDLERHAERLSQRLQHQTRVLRAVLDVHGGT